MMLEQKRERVVALEAQALVRRTHLAALEKKCALLEEYFGYTLIGEPLLGAKVLPTGEASGWLTKKGAFNRWNPRFVKLYSTGRFAGTLRFYANDDTKKEKSCIDLGQCDDIRWATNGSNCSQLQIVTPKETFSIETTGTKRPIKHERASAEMWRSAIARILTVAKARRLEDQHRMDARRHLCEEVSTQ